VTQSAKKSNLRRGSARIDSKLNKNLTAYVTAAGAAGVSLLALAQPVSAKVIYTSYYTTLGDTFLDINHDGVVDFPIRGYGFCISGQYSSLCGGSEALNASSPGGRFMGAPGFASALRAGAKIGPAGQFSAREIIASNWERPFSGSAKPPNWFGPLANDGKGVRDRYLGLKFSIHGQTHYGWLRISVHIPNAKKNGFNAFITGYAYETEANTAIIAGQETGAVETSCSSQPGSRQHLADPHTNPTQASLGMLARGVDTLAIWRRDAEVAHENDRSALPA
jgi:hypothetical protein